MNKKKFIAAVAATLVLCFVLSGCSLFKAEQADPVVYELHYSRDDDYLIGVAKTAMKGMVEIETSITSTGKKYAGSGVIVALDDPSNPKLAYIITNNHVVSGEGNEAVRARIIITVRFIDSDETVKNTDITLLDRTLTSTSSDLALLSVPYKSIPNKYKRQDEGSGEYKYTPVSYSSDLDYGQHILAVGNGLNYGTSVCDGLISNPSVYVNSTSFKAYAIQISAPINSGNSGGGLFDMKANLVGINTLKAVADGPNDKASVYADNISFAIKMTDVEEFINKYNTGKQASQTIRMTKAS